MKPTNILRECRSIGLGLWQCPPFLFLVMGFVTITSMIGVSLLSSRYFEEPEVPTILIVSFIAVLFLIIGNAIINGFSKITEANRIKSQFVSIISHQLRTPVSIFKWTLESLEQTIKKPELYDETNASILNLQDASKKMIHLVNTLLDVTRIEGGTLTLQSEDVPLVKMLNAVMSDFQRYAESSHVILSMESDADIPLVHVDRSRIIMVMQTFIDNAVRYSPQKGTVHVLLKKEGAFIRFSVSDTGVGIPAIQQKNIFDKFFRASNIMQYQTEGTGIDLFISKYIIEASRGTIGFTSEENKGSTFWFVLPIKK